MTLRIRSAVGKALAAAFAALMPMVTFAVPASASPSSGLNDWTCRPSPAHPRPVVLLHGAGGSGTMSWLLYGPQLHAAGYCVFAPTYGARLPGVPLGGMEPVRKMAWEISHYLERVLKTTGAEKVDLVGHSLGGFEGVYIPKFIPGKAERIGRVVSLGGPIRGTNYSGGLYIADALLLRAPFDSFNKQFFIAPFAELVEGGDLPEQLMTGRITQPGIDYTMIATEHDEATTPHDRAFIHEPGVKNIFVQHHCSEDISGHFDLLYNATVSALIQRALDPRRPRRIPCGLSLPV